MAVINYFDDILEEATKTEEVLNKISIKELVDKYVLEKGDDSQSIEVYHADTDTTEFQKLEPDTYKIITIVDGQEVPIDYVIEANVEVVVSIMFIPESSDAGKAIGGSVLVLGGVALALTGVGLIGAFGASAGMFASATWAAVGAVALFGGTLVTLAGLSTLSKIGKDKDKNKDGRTDQKSLPYLNGAENEEIIGNRYPFVMGKHLLAPRIIGSPYHETRVLSNGKALDGGQYYHILYCAGYGPLKITDIKLGENILAYNRSSSSAERKTIYHGQLSGTGTNSDNGDITIKYKDNDVKIEILQAGDKSKDITQKMYAWKNVLKQVKYTYSENVEVHDIVYSASNVAQFTVYSVEKDSSGKVTSFTVQLVNDEKLASFAGLKLEFTRDSSNDKTVVLGNDRYGTVYPEVCLEKQVDANCLYIYDKDVYDVQDENRPYVLYYNKSLPSGFRNNTVRMSSSCPRELEVELDFPNGLFGTRQKRGDKNAPFNTYYHNIPLNIAVQWRFTGPNISSSNAESPDGWKTFDYIHFSEGEFDGVKYAEQKIAPKAYTNSDRVAEIEQNKGLSPNTPAKHNENWLGSKVFKLTQYETQRVNLNQSEIQTAIQLGFLTRTPTLVNIPLRVEIHTYPYVIEQTVQATIDIYKVTPEGTSMGIGVDEVNNIPWKESTDGMSVFDEKKFTDISDFNIDERRYVFKYSFTEEECRKLAGFTGENILDVVEVRVIRISPCYINEAGKSSDTTTDMNYQDIFKWTYLRTKTFDKAKYLKALREAEKMES